MIEKMKRTPKARHGYKVWFRQGSLRETVETLHKMLECADYVEYSVDVQYQKPSVLVYTDSDEHAKYFDKLVWEDKVDV